MWRETRSPAWLSVCVCWAEEEEMRPERSRGPGSVGLVES